MSDEKKIITNVEEENNKEIDLETLENVSGGAIGNVKYTPREDISDDTANKI